MKLRALVWARRAQGSKPEGGIPGEGSVRKRKVAGGEFGMVKYLGGSEGGVLRSEKKGAKAAGYNRPVVVVRA